MFKITARVTKNFILLPITLASLCFKTLLFILKHPKQTLKTMYLGARHFVSFNFLLVLYLISFFVISRLGSVPFLPVNLKVSLQNTLSSYYARFVNIFDIRKPGSLSKLDLIDLSFRNMKAKKTRTFITIGGMSIGIGAIVYLVSLGYGLQRVVVSRVARLDELKQAEISTQTGGREKINDGTLAKIRDIQEVKAVLPLIAVVGKVNFNNSISDMAIFGVTSDYLAQSAIKPSSGKIFDSNAISYIFEEGEVAGISTVAVEAEYLAKISDIEFNINPNSWVRVRENPATTSKILGYAKRTEGSLIGEEVYGSSYESDDGSGKVGSDSSGKQLGRWIKTKTYLFRKEDCNEANKDCVEGKYTILREEEGSQVQSVGYIAEVNITIISKRGDSEEVLGESTTSAAPSGDLGITIKESDGEYVEIIEETKKVSDTKSVELPEIALKQAVVNRAVLKLLNLKESDAVGSKFQISFIVPRTLQPESEQRIESVPTQYSIVGVIPDETTPYIYVPFLDIRSLGVVNFSQAKLVVNDKDRLADVRKKVESMGFITSSVVDTIAQINTLFSTLRTVLASMGMMALTVAALGMFNTFTISLLERTREVGLMKAMGMKSSEVQELFLTESMTMGVFGGILGLVIGFVLGKFTGLVLSSISVLKGQGLIDISFIPPSFIVVSIMLSIVVGVFTGIYPARRAKRISALNALRYE